MTWWQEMTFTSMHSLICIFYKKIEYKSLYGMEFHFLFLEFVIKETFVFCCCQFIATCQACQYYYQRKQSSFDIVRHTLEIAVTFQNSFHACTFCVITTNTLPIKINIFWEGHKNFTKSPSWFVFCLVSDKSTGRFRHIWPSQNI